MINWDDAPEGATGAIEHKNDSPYKEYGYPHGRFVSESNEAPDGYRYCSINDRWPAMEYYSFIPKPATPKSWNGEGLPPIGTECTVINCGNEHTGKVTYISEQYVILLEEHGEQHFHTSNLKFEPIDTRTDEQKAIDDFMRFEPLVRGDYEYILDQIKAGKIHGIKFTK